VPGLDWLSAIHEGIVIDGTHTFAGLGTTSGSHPSDATLTFLTLVTAGLQPTNLSITGQYGYQGHDYGVNQSATFVPEPAGAMLVLSRALAWDYRCTGIGGHPRSTGWSGILSSLKSLLETGESLEHTRKWPTGM